MAFGQRSQLASQPGQQPPDGGMVQCPFVDTLCTGSRLVAGRSALGAGRLAIRLPIVLQISRTQIKERLLGITLIGKYESRDNR